MTASGCGLWWSDLAAQLGQWTSGGGSCWAGLVPRTGRGAADGDEKDRVIVAWRAQAARAKATYAKFVTERDAAEAIAHGSGLNQAIVDDQHFEVLRSGDWFVMLSEMNKTDFDTAAMTGGTGTCVHPKAHLRTVHFTLPRGATLEVTDEDADLTRLFPNDTAHRGRKFVRVRAAISRRGFPVFGNSHFLVSGRDGHRLAPTTPVNFSNFWTKKSNGYAKYGPTFVQFLDSFELSQHPSDKVEVILASGKTMVTPLSDKTRPKSGGEKVVVRGFHKLENLQRHKFVFPKVSHGNLLCDSVDGYLESVAFSALELQLTLLVPHEDDVTSHSFPFGPDHSAPEKFYHHHNSYSRMFHVRPLTGRELVALAGERRRVLLPAGTVMEQTLFGLLEVGAGCAIAAGVEVGADIAAGAIAEGAIGCAVEASGAAAVEGVAAVAAEGTVEVAAEGAVEVAAEGGAEATAEGGAEATAEGGAEATTEGGTEAAAKGGAEALTLKVVAKKCLQKFVEQLLEKLGIPKEAIEALEFMDDFVEMSLSPKTAAEVAEWFAKKLIEHEVSHKITESFEFIKDRCEDAVKEQREQGGSRQSKM